MISVIIPFYHGNAYINGLLAILQKNDELLRAETKQSMEVVIVNDSPDEKVLLEPFETAMQIRVVENEVNIGIHRSRVHGLEEAQGEYIFFLDQDDTIEDRFAVSQYQAIGDCDFVIANGWMRMADGETKPIYATEAMQKRCLALKTYYYYSNLIISPGQVLMKKDAVPQAWKTDILKRNGADDCYLWLLLLESGAVGAINTEQLYTHVYTGSNTSLDVKEMMHSNLEVISFMKGKSSKRYLRAMKRRSEYYGNYKSSLGYKLKYLDVGIHRFFYSR